jgi:hypothetical protein
MRTKGQHLNFGISHKATGWILVFYVKVFRIYNTKTIGTILAQQVDEGKKKKKKNL